MLCAFYCILSVRLPWELSSIYLFYVFHFPCRDFIQMPNPTVHRWCCILICKRVCNLLEMRFAHNLIDLLQFNLQIDCKLIWFSLFLSVYSRYFPSRKHHNYLPESATDRRSTTQTQKKNSKCNGSYACKWLLANSFRDYWNPLGVKNEHCYGNTVTVMKKKAIKSSVQCTERK